VFAQGNDRVRAGGGAWGQVGEFVAADGELVKAGGQVSAALAAGALDEAAVLEGGQVAVDRGSVEPWVPWDTAAVFSSY
jgi:hypothetical protein